MPLVHLLWGYKHHEYALVWLCGCAEEAALGPPLSHILLKSCGTADSAGSQAGSGKYTGSRLLQVTTPMVLQC